MKFEQALLKMQKKEKDFPGSGVFMYRRRWDHIGTRPIVKFDRVNYIAVRGPVLVKGWKTSKRQEPFSPSQSEMFADDWEVKIKEEKQ